MCACTILWTFELLNWILIFIHEQATKDWVKAVQSEWNLLQKNLPGQFICLFDKFVHLYLSNYQYFNTECWVLLGISCIDCDQKLFQVSIFINVLFIVSAELPVVTKNQRIGFHIIITYIILFTILFHDNLAMLAYCWYSEVIIFILGNKWENVKKKVCRYKIVCPRGNAMPLLMHIMPLWLTFKPDSPHS